MTKFSAPVFIFSCHRWHYTVQTQTFKMPDLRHILSPEPVVGNLVRLRSAATMAGVRQLDPRSMSMKGRFWEAIFLPKVDSGLLWPQFPCS